MHRERKGSRPGGGGTAARRAEPDPEAARKVEQHFRHEIAGVAERPLSFLFRFPYEIVIGFQKKLFELPQVYKISHVLPFPFLPGAPPRRFTQFHTTIQFRK